MQENKFGLTLICKRILASAMPPGKVAFIAETKGFGWMSAGNFCQIVQISEFAWKM